MKIHRDDANSSEGCPHGLMCRFRSQVLFTAQKNQTKHTGKNLLCCKNKANPMTPGDEERKELTFGTLHLPLCSANGISTGGWRLWLARDDLVHELVVRQRSDRPVERARVWFDQPTVVKCYADEVEDQHLRSVLKLADAEWKAKDNNQTTLRGESRPPGDHSPVSKTMQKNSVSFDRF